MHLVHSSRSANKWAPLTYTFVIVSWKSASDVHLVTLRYFPSKAKIHLQPQSANISTIFDIQKLSSQPLVVQILKMCLFSHFVSFRYCQMYWEAFRKEFLKNPHADWTECIDQEEYCRSFLQYRHKETKSSLQIRNNKSKSQTQYHGTLIYLNNVPMSAGNSGNIIGNTCWQFASMKWFSLCSPPTSYLVYHSGAEAIGEWMKLLWTNNNQRNKKKKKKQSERPVYTELLKYS